ncbi:MAG: FlgD immunoglobulin-like domain containing protein [Paludibacter sp.]|nr:FlgD immunoglobulin-like domain containing protein [Paludibacter sp.]
MKNKFPITIMAFLCFFSYTGKAQSVFVVEPGVGTLNQAIKTYGGNRIYQLKAGEWYQLNGVIENVNYHLQIIGQEPAVKGGIPATLQTGTDAGGATFAQMFAAKGDITIKNVYIVNADLNGVVGNFLINNSATNARTIIDRCIIDPVCNTNAISMLGKNSKTYFTNNLCIRMGHQLSPNDGHFFVTQNESGAGFDSLLVQNNTFVCMGTTMHMAGFGLYLNNYSKWDHNTFVEQKSQIDWSVFENEYYWTNNLMFDMQTQPWSPTWQPMPGADKGFPKPCLIYADTIQGEILPSQRVQFVQYNMHYRNPKFYTMLNELNAQGKIDGKITINYMSLMYSKDSSAVSRESNMFNNPTSFPYWKAGNNTTEVNPQWADARIYTMSDNYVKWTKPATQIHAMNYAANLVPAVSTWTQYFWDPDGDVSNNLTWPVFNGVYSNPALLIGSIEGLPLGDLNWYPDAKALWTKNKTRIDAHMKAAIESKITMLTGLNSINLSDIKTSCYPNPFTNELTVSYTVKNHADVKLTILSLNGQTVAELVNQSKSAGEYKVKWNGTNAEGASMPNGIYLYRLQIGNEVASARIIKTK